MYDLEIILSFCELSFHFIDSALGGTKVFNYDKAQFTYFLFVIYVLVSYLRNHCLTQGHKIISMFSVKSCIVVAFTLRSLIQVHLFLYMM